MPSASSLSAACPPPPPPPPPPPSSPPPSPRWATATATANKKNTRIAIIGAGPSGLYTATRLKAAGFTQIELFEAAPRVGGRCWSRVEEGVSHELGFSTNILSDATNPLSELAQTYGLTNELVVVGGGTVAEMSQEGGDDNIITREETAERQQQSSSSSPYRVYPLPEEAIKMNHLASPPGIRGYYGRWIEEEIEFMHDEDDVDEEGEDGEDVDEEEETGAAPVDTRQQQPGDSTIATSSNLRRHHPAYSLSTSQRSHLSSSSSSSPHAHTTHDTFKRQVSELSSTIRAASTTGLPPLRRLLSRRISGIKDQVASFLGKEPLVSAARRYTRLHRQFLGDVALGLPPKPKEEDLFHLNISFVDWLNVHGLIQLIPLFVLCPIAFSYQFLSEVPAFYGLSWYHPERVTALIDFKKGALRVPRYTMLRCGWQGLWAKMAEVEGLKVHLTSQVQSIRRPDGNKKAGELVVVSTAAAGAAEAAETHHQFDLLVLACNLKSIIPLLLDATEEEKLLATNLAEYTLCTTIFQSARVKGERPIEVFPFPKRGSAFGQVFVQINPRLAAGADNDEEEEEEEDNDVYEGERGRRSTHSTTTSSNINRPTTANNKPKDKRIVYQFLQRPPRPEDMEMLKRRLKMYFSDTSVQSPLLIKQCPWKFFTHFPADAIVKDGWPWRLEQMQGTNSTLYMGAGACVDALNEVLLYDQQVLKRLGL